MTINDHQINVVFGWTNEWMNGKFVTAGSVINDKNWWIKKIITMIRFSDGLKLVRQQKQLVEKKSFYIKQNSHYFDFVD